MTNVKQTTEQSLISEILDSAAFSNRWRENFLNIVMRVMVALGIVMFAVTFLHGDIRILAAYSVILLLLLVITFAPVPYSIRAGVFSGLIYLVGVTILVGYGISADASTFLLAFIAITALLFDYRAGLGALVLSILTMIIIDWMVMSGFFKLLVSSGTTGAIADWITYGLDMSVPGAVIILAVFFLKREFNKVLYQVREIFQALQAGQAQLEERVAERTVDLMQANQKTAEQASRLRTVAEVSRSAAAIPEQDRLMNLLTNLISQQLGYYHVGIFLLDELREYAILSASNSEGGKRMLARGHRLQVGQQGMVGYATSSGKPRIALNVGADAVFFNNPDLPETRSEMCLPLIVNEVIIGALDIQSTEANAFTEEDYSVLSILADQVAIAIQNARSNEETKRALQEAEIASGQLTNRAWKEFSSERDVKGYRFRGTKAQSIQGRSNEAEANGLTNVPIRLHGQIIGNLKLNRTDETHSWTEDELAIVQATAERVALAMENARLLEDAQRNAVKEQRITDVTAKISRSINLRNVLQTAVEELGRVIPGSDVVIQFQDNSEKRPL
jgi:GAF domain-containing protein